MLSSDSDARGNSSQKFSMKEKGSISIRCCLFSSEFSFIRLLNRECREPMFVSEEVLGSYDTIVY